MLSKNEISKVWRPLKRPRILTLLEFSFSSLKFGESMLHEIEIHTQSCTYARDRRFSSSLGLICPYCESSPRHEWEPAGPPHLPSSAQSARTFSRVIASNRNSLEAFLEFSETRLGKTGNFIMIKRSVNKQNELDHEKGVRLKSSTCVTSGLTNICNFPLITQKRDYSVINIKPNFLKSN